MVLVHCCCASCCRVITGVDRQRSSFSGQRQMKHRHDKAQAHDDRLDTIRKDLILRIRPICMEMPDELFFELIESMAAVQLKYELTEPRVAH